MDYFEYLKSKENISIYEALEVLAPLFVKVHKWNIGDDVNKVRYQKYELLQKLLVQIVDNKTIEGNIFRDYEYDQYDIISNNSHEGPVKVVYYGKSYINSSMLYNYMSYYLNENGYDIPEELSKLATKKSGGDYKECIGTKTATDSPVTVKDEKMKGLANISHKSSQEVKSVIRELVKTEMLKENCTCLNSQMFRYVRKQADRGDSGLTLKYKRGSVIQMISDSVLRKEVNAIVRVVDPTRMQDKNMVLEKCEVHGLNK